MAASAGSIRAGKAHVELSSDDSKLVAGLRATQAKLQQWGRSVSEAGKQLFLFGAAGVAAGTGALLMFAKMGADLVELSAKTGQTVEALQGLATSRIISTAEAHAARDFWIQIQNLGAEVQKLVFVIGQQLLPVAKPILQFLFGA